MSNTSASRPLFIRPQDVWLFRDGKPFDAGSDHRAASLFPPMPTVVQGMLRRLLLDQKHIDLNDSTNVAKHVGKQTDFADLRLRGPWIRKGDELFFELPADTYPDGDNTFRVLTSQEITNTNAYAVSNPHEFKLMLLPPKNATPHKPKTGFVSQTEMQKYLHGGSFAVTAQSELFQREIRPSTAIESSTKRAQDGRLFQVEFIRPNPDVGLHVEWLAGLSGLKPNGGPGTLGGESHWAGLAEQPLSRPLQQPVIPPNCKQFKMILLTPTFFEHGWHPTDWSSFFVGGKVELQAAAVNRYISLGGFDLAQQAHKPALRYVPAGSVYYFKVISDNPQLMASRPWLCDISPEAGDLGQIGFGQVSITPW